MSLLLTLEEAAADGGGFDSGFLTNGDFATGDLTGWTVNPLTRWEYSFVDPYHTAYFIDNFTGWLEQLTYEWLDNTDYQLSYRVVDSGPDMLCTVHDGDSSNLIGTLHRGLPTPPGVYTIDFTTGVGWTTGIRFYGQNTEQFFKITELSLKLR